MWCLEHDVPFGWDLTTLLLTDLFAAHTGETHPARAEIAEKARYRETVERLKRQRARHARTP